jgi:hypothetical protein
MQKKKKKKSSMMVGRSSILAKYEGQRITRKCGMPKKKHFTDNKEQSFTPPNFKFKFNFMILKKELMIIEYKSLVAFFKEEICPKQC